MIKANDEEPSKPSWWAKVTDFFHTRQSSLNEKLSPLLSSFDLPYAFGSTYSVEKAVREGYSQNVWVYRCVNLIAQAFEMVNFLEIDKRQKQVVKSNVTRLLQNPCPELSPHDFYHFLIKQWELTGNAYLIKVKIAGETRELFPLFSDKVEVITSSRPGRLIESYRLRDSGKLLDPAQVIHLKNINPANALQGISPLQAASSAIDIANQQNDWNYHGLRNRFVSDLILFLRDGFSQEQAFTLKEKILSDYSTSRNARKIMLLSGIDRVEKVGANAVDSDFNEGKKIVREEIAAAFGIPLPLLGVLENATYSNFETAERVFWEQTLIPKLEAFVSGLNWSLADELGDHQISYDTSAVKVLQSNYSARLKDALLLQQLGLPLSEINRKLELNLNLDDRL